MELSKIMISEETFLGQVIHTVEVVQIQTIEKFSTWSKLVLSNIEKHLKYIVLLKFSTPSEKHIDMTRKWLWNGKECIITVTIIMDLNEYKHTMLSISMQCV